MDKFTLVLLAKTIVMVTLGGAIGIGSAWLGDRRRNVPQEKTHR